MSNIMRLFGTAKSALQTYQTALEVTGNNIANINKEGYTRRRVDLTTKSSIRTYQGFIGTGVDVSQITRIHDKLLEKQGNLAIQENGRWKAETDFLQVVETVFNEGSDKELSSLIGNFFNDWYNLANNTEDFSMRTSLMASSSVMTGRVNQIYNKLKDVRSTIDDKISGMVGDIDRLAKQVANINLNIISGEGGGVMANGLRDARDTAISELSELVDVSVLEQNNGSFNILVAGTNLLVSGSRTASVEFKLDKTSPINPVSSILVDGIDISSTVYKGELKGLVNVRDTILPGVLKEMDDFAAALISSVNTLHTQGNAMGGGTGFNFFESFTQTTPGNNQGAAALFTLSSDVMSNPNNIAAGTTAAPGNNANALGIADLRNAQVTFTAQRTQTFIGFYSETVASLGGVAREAQNSLEHSDALKTQFEGLEESISGVSLDEELSKMVVFQRAYESSARFFTTVDKMLDTIINRLGA